MSIWAGPVAKATCSLPVDLQALKASWNDARHSRPVAMGTGEASVQGEQEVPRNSHPQKQRCNGRQGLQVGAPAAFFLHCHHASSRAALRGGPHQEPLHNTPLSARRPHLIPPFLGSPPKETTVTQIPVLASHQKELKAA